MSEPSKMDVKFAFQIQIQIQIQIQFNSIQYHAAFIGPRKTSNLNFPNGGKRQV